MRKHLRPSSTGAVLRQDLLRELQVRYQNEYGKVLSKESLSYLLDNFFDAIRESIQSGKVVQVIGFGTFYRGKAHHWHCKYDVIEFRMATKFRRIGYLNPDDVLL